MSLFVCIKYTPRAAGERIWIRALAGLLKRCLLQIINRAIAMSTMVGEVYEINIFPSILIGIH